MQWKQPGKQLHIRIEGVLICGSNDGTTPVDEPPETCGWLGGELHSNLDVELQHEAMMTNTVQTHVLSNQKHRLCSASVPF
jgi:hypothetical protein